MKPATPRRLLIAVAVVVLVVAGGGVLKATRTGGGWLEALRRGPGAPEVLLIGVDGVDPRILEGLIAAGRLPTFARLQREGAYGRLRSREPLLSPIVWTTIVTGRKGQDHGVLDFLEVTDDGRTLPITSRQRRVPALWNLLDDAGRVSGFIGWYASYPAERVRGFMVSDRLAFHQVRSERAASGGTYPPTLSDELRTRVGEPTPDTARTRARFLSDPAAPLTEDGRHRLEQLARIHATTEFYRRAAADLSARFHPEVLGVYFEAVDACEHLFMEDAPPRRPDVSDGDFRDFSGVVGRCYEYQDEVLADVLRLAGPRTVTVVCSDHGFKSGNMRPRTPGRADVGLAALWHLLDGVVFVHGRSVRSGAEIAGATVLDIAPTVLRVLGLPLSRELPGRPLEDVFEAGALPASRSVARYVWTPPPAAAAPAAGDDARFEELRALGYLGGRTPGTIPREAGGRTAASYLNEGWSLAADGDFEGALRAYATALRLDPRNVNARAFSARVLLQRHDTAAAKPLLEEAVALDPADPYVRLLRASRALDDRQWTAAAAELDAAARLDDRLPMVHLLRARLVDATGNPAAALPELDRAAQLTDAAEGLLAEILMRRADVATRLGRWGEAEEALGRATRLVPPARLAAGRGDLAMAQGDGVRAAGQFRLAAAADPRSSPLERKLGQALGASRAYAESEAAFRRALAKAATDEEKEGAYGDLSLLFQGAGQEQRTRAILEEGLRALPRSAALWGMLGAAHGREGRLDLAVEAYERSVSLGPTPLACKTLAALLLDQRRDRRRAVALWRQSLSLDPEQPDVRRFLRRYGAAAPLDAPAGRD